MAALMHFPPNSGHAGLQSFVSLADGLQMALSPQTAWDRPGTVILAIQTLVD